MDDALRGFLEDRFDKLETSIVRLYDKLDSISKETNGNTKDIENIKDTFDDKLKGIRINSEACQNNCRGFRASLKEEMTDSINTNIKLLESKTKNWIYGLIGSGVVTILLFVANKLWGK